MKTRIQRWWDEFVYRASRKSLNRYFSLNPGYAYLIELGLRKMRKDSGMSPELKEATEHFFEAMQAERQKRFIEECSRL